MDAKQYRALVTRLERIVNEAAELKIGDIDPSNGRKILNALVDGSGNVVRNGSGEIWNVEYGPADAPAEEPAPNFTARPPAEPAPREEPQAATEPAPEPAPEPTPVQTQPATSTNRLAKKPPISNKNVGTIALQHWLNAHGGRPTLTTDGIYGPNTDKAVKSLSGKMSNNPEYNEMVAAGTAYRTPGGVEKVTATSGAGATLVKYGFDPHTGQPKNPDRPAQAGVYPTQDAADINKNGWKAATQPVKPRPTTNPLQQQVWDSQYSKQYNWDGTPRTVPLTDPSNASIKSESLDELALLQSRINKILGQSHN
jgi:peptidoglycan hydrolase-like protein with peptidoglycan-binding domain